MKFILFVLFLCFLRYATYVPQRELKGGETVVITNATSDIGWVTALELNKKGVFVYAGVLDKGTGKKLQEAATNQSALKPIILDVRNPKSIKDAVELVKTELGESKGLVGLVNNAALLSPFSDFTETSAATWQETFAVNVVSVVETTRAFIPLLQKGSGSLIFHSTVLGTLGLPFSTANSATSYALQGFVDSLRREVAPVGVKVSLVTSNMPEPQFMEYSAQVNAELCAQQVQHRSHVARLLLTPLLSLADPATVGTALADAATAIVPNARYNVNLGAAVLSVLPSIVSDWVLALAVANAERCSGLLAPPASGAKGDEKRGTHREL